MVAFPEEILNQICWNLEPSMEHVMNTEQVLRRGTLFNLLCCSKTFYRLARSVLYHTLTVTRPSITLQTLYQLCANDPSLALLVREIHFGYFPSSSRPYANRDSPTEISDLDLTSPSAEYLEIFSEGLRGDLVSLLDDRDPDAMIALLLVMCKNLTAIDLHTSHWPGSLVLRVVEELTSPATLSPSAPSSSSLPLRLLRSFRTEPWHPSVFQPLITFQPFLSLPSMRTFTGERMVFPEWREFPDPSGISVPLRYLKLTGSSINPDGLEWFLTSCPELKDFEVEIGFKWDIDERMIIGWDSLWEELITHAKGLERIVLGIKDDWVYHEDDTFEDLRGFADLRVLHLEWEAIYGTDREDAIVDDSRKEEGFLEDFLPTTLEEFAIRNSPMSLDYMDFWDAQIMRVMKSDRFVRLSTIKMKRDGKFTLELPLGWREYSMDVEAPKGVRAYRPDRDGNYPDSKDPKFEVSMRLVRER